MLQPAELPISQAASKTNSSAICPSTAAGRTQSHRSTSISFPRPVSSENGFIVPTISETTRKVGKWCQTSGTRAPVADKCESRCARSLTKYWFEGKIRGMRWPPPFEHRIRRDCVTSKTYRGSSPTDPISSGRCQGTGCPKTTRSTSSWRPSPRSIQDRVSAQRRTAHLVWPRPSLGV
jgi:hypothetical protein